MSNLVPDGWERCVIGKKFKFLGGYAFKSLDSVDSGTRWLKIANVGIGKVKWEERSYLPSNFIDEHPNYVLNQGDCVVALTRPIIRGELKVAQIKSYDSPSLLNQRVAKVKFNNQLVDNDFVYSMMRYEEISREIEITIFGTDPPNLSTKQLEEIKVNFPPLPEQQKIAKILTSVDEVIEKTQAQIDKLKDLKIGMMQELLTNGIGHTEFKDSPVGRIPAEWKVKAVESVLAEIIDYRGKAPPKSEVGVPLITAKNIRNGFINQEPREYIFEEQFDSWMVRGMPKYGDVFITTEAPLGNVAKVPNYKFAIGQRVLTLRPNELICTEFLLFILQGEKFKKELDLQSTGSTVAGIKQSTFRKVLLPVPPIDEQIKISENLNSIVSRIDATQNKLQHFKSLKKALMQDLLTGKVRVKVDR
ncbi:restriction endonuclease subunit S [Colwellia polaris]|uniref:restriction endonuclease subunit S n=1 Tax=Colwellia polaris TaxID=326537 RepID=UPI000A1719D6|nr:restriction endonuclease subunit S [Colwellia polaris]